MPRPENKAIQDCVTTTSLPIKFKDDLEQYGLIFGEEYTDMETCVPVNLPTGWKLHGDGFFLHLIDDQQHRRFTMVPICENHDRTVWQRCLYPCS